MVAVRDVGIRDDQRRWNIPMAGVYSVWWKDLCDAGVVLRRASREHAFRGWHAEGLTLEGVSEMVNATYSLLVQRPCSLYPVAFLPVVFPDSSVGLLAP